MKDSTQRNSGGTADVTSESIESVNGGCSPTACSASLFDWRVGMPKHLVDKYEKSYPWKFEDGSIMPDHLAPCYMGVDKNGEERVTFIQKGVKISLTAQ